MNLAILKVWLGGAFAAFMDGFIDGAPIGAPAGAGLGYVTGQFHADLGWKHLAVEALHVLAVPVSTGLADVREYRKSNPFPNIFQPATPQPTNK